MVRVVASPGGVETVDRGSRLFPPDGAGSGILLLHLFFPKESGRSAAGSIARFAQKPQWVSTLPLTYLQKTLINPEIFDNFSLFQKTALTIAYPRQDSMMMQVMTRNRHPAERSVSPLGLFPPSPVCSISVTNKAGAPWFHLTFPSPFSFRQRAVSYSTFNVFRSVH